jgi:hypothetical protein
MPKYLYVPYHEKEQVKALGGKWDWRENKWFIPDGISERLFARWLLISTVNVRAKMFCLAKSYGTCWKCGQTGPVFSFFLPVCEDLRWDEEGEYWGNDSTAMLCNIRFLSENIIELIAHAFPQYKIDFSNTVGYPYFMNHCVYCGAKLGDFFLHGELGASFNPDEYNSDVISFLDIHEPFQANAQWHGSSVLAGLRE